MPISKKKIIIFIIVFLLLVLTLFFFQNSDLNKREVEISSQDLETYVVLNESDKLVTGFPDLPRYPDSQIIGSKSYTEEGGIGFEAEYNVESTIDEIISWYKQHLVDSGWEISYEPKLPSDLKTTLLSAKLNNRLLHIRTQIINDNKISINVTHHEGMGEYSLDE